MPLSRTRQTLGVGMVGYAFMGAAHSQAWRTAPRFFDLPHAAADVRPGRPNEARAKAAAESYGWDDVETDWTRLLGRDDIDLVDICTPGDTHAEIAIAALEAGKHVLCEKPLANTVAEARRWRRRRVARPPRAYARCAASTTAGCPPSGSGRPGRGRGHRHRPPRAGRYLQDWLVDPAAPLVVAAAEGPGRVGGARRHRRAHRRHGAVRDRRPDHRGNGLDRDVRQRRPLAPRTASSA